LIALMIDVRSAKTGHDLKKDLSSDRSEDIFLLAKAYPTHTAAGRGWFMRTRLPHVSNMPPLYDVKHPQAPLPKGNRESQ
jgi:hypothetical protein